MGYITSCLFAHSASGSKMHPAIGEGLQQAYAAVASDQREAAAFILASGGEVLAGHPPVRKAGTQGDPQLGLEPTDG
jgi:hypothetical protein